MSELERESGPYFGRYRGAGRISLRLKGAKSGGKTRSVVKANYFPARGGVAKARSSLRYYASRANEAGDKQDRDIFTKTEDRAPMQEVTRQLKALMQEDGYELAYRMILSPDAAKDMSAESLREWTREMLATIEVSHKVHWVAVAHTEQNAHTAHAHVHVVAVLDRRLSKEELASLRQHGDAHWQDIVRRQQLLEQVPTRRPELEPQLGAERPQLQDAQNISRSAGLEL